MATEDAVPPMRCPGSGTAGYSSGYKNQGGMRTPVSTAAGEMTPSSLRSEIKEKAAASLKDKVEAPAGEKKKDKASDEVRKAEQAEYARRLNAGEPVPWDELYV